MILGSKKWGTEDMERGSDTTKEGKNPPFFFRELGVGKSQRNRPKRGRGVGHFVPTPDDPSGTGEVSGQISG